MSAQTAKRICPVEKAGSLDNKIRRLVHNPKRILGPFIKEGMTVLDVGCGPGYFSIEMAKLVGETGQVIAADLQEGMLHRLSTKIEGTILESRISLHKCESDTLGVTDSVDFVLLFYMLHEVPDAGKLLAELATILSQNGRILIVEPPFHVSKSDFSKTIQKTKETGFTVAETPKYFLDKAVVLQKSQTTRH